MRAEQYLFVVSGPSGAGKDTVVKRVRCMHPEVQRAVTTTTRAMRPGEKDGVTYYYLTKEAFEQKIQHNELVEYTNYCGKFYGTLRTEVESRMAVKIPVILVIEIEGASNIKRLYPGATTVFIMPPSREELERRLRQRGTETEEEIQNRLSRADREMTFASRFDERIVNDDADRCAEDLYTIIKQNLDRLQGDADTNAAAL